MKCHSKKIVDSKKLNAKPAFTPLEIRLAAGMPDVQRGLLMGFSLVEAVAAVMVLAIVCSGVFVVISRCVASAADSVLRMQAFEVARENMETLLSGDSVEEVVDYGSSDKYPEIQWETTVETFLEPLSTQMWVRAICSAEYTDSAGEVQKIELTHWLTHLSKQQLLQIFAERQEENLLAELQKTGQGGGADAEKICGYTIEELNRMDFNQLWEVLSNCDQF